MEVSISDLPNIMTIVVVIMFMIIPSVMAAWPILLSRMQDVYPDEIRQGNLLYMLLSPHLDRKSIHEGKTPQEILKDSMTIGLRDMTDRVVNPVIAPINTVQDTLGNTFGVITNAIQEGVTIPMRGMYTLGTSLTESLQKSFTGIAGSVTGMIQTIQSVLNSMVSGVLVGLYMQATSFNLAVSGIKFFLWIAEMAGIVTTVVGGLMMISIFTIIPGIVLVTLGGILTGIAVDSKNVMNKVNDSAIRIA